MAEYASRTSLSPIPPDSHKATERWLNSLMDGDSSESTADIRATMQYEMMDKSSVVRTEDSLNEMLNIIDSLRSRYAKARVKDRSKVFNTEIIEHAELGFLLDMAEALVVSARARTESRGGHYREDHQLREDNHWMKHTFITRKADGQTRLAYKDVTPGRYEPVERKY
jgi:succinate dehydrogenase / fumarate reductase flavoprotein subunit